MIEFPRQGNHPHPLGLRGVEHRPGNFNHLALVNPPPRPRDTPRTTPWHRTRASTFDQIGPSCTVAGTIGMLITLPFRYGFQPDRAAYDTEQERYDFYLWIQQFDPWAAYPHDGSSPDAPLIGLRQRGVISGWDWIIGEEELWEWVSFWASACVGTIWDNNMFYPDSKGYLQRGGGMAGGHEYEIIFASHERQAYRIVNSWGMWGDQGRAWIPRDMMRTLLADDGEAVTIKLAS